MGPPEKELKVRKTDTANYATNQLLSSKQSPLRSMDVGKKSVDRSAPKKRSFDVGNPAHRSTFSQLKHHEKSQPRPKAYVAEPAVLQQVVKVVSGVSGSGGEHLHEEYWIPIAPGEPSE